MLRFQSFLGEYLLTEAQQFQLADMQRELDRLSNQARFVQMIIDNKLTISKKQKNVLMAELKKLGFKAYAKLEDAKTAGEEQQVAEELGDEEDAAMGARDYDYLLGVCSFSISSITVADLFRCLCGLSHRKESKNCGAK